MFAGRFGIQLKTKAQLDLMRAAGLVVAEALTASGSHCRDGSTTGELNEAAADAIASAGATPSFLGYPGYPAGLGHRGYSAGLGHHGYPASTCVSVNEEVVHGIPGNRVLRSGDIVSIDCGAIVEGWHGDAALTLLVPERGVEPATAGILHRTEPVIETGDRVFPQRRSNTLAASDALMEEWSGEERAVHLSRLSMSAKDALWRGLDVAMPGAHLSDIGAAIEKSLRGSGLGIVTDFAGHGIGSEMHMRPDVMNVGPAGRGPRLKAGMVLAIEPMITDGAAAVSTLADGWTVTTNDRSWAAHWEHTVAITDDGPWVLTEPDLSHG